VRYEALKVANIHPRGNCTHTIKSLPSHPILFLTQRISHSGGKQVSLPTFSQPIASSYSQPNCTLFLPVLCILLLHYFTIILPSTVSFPIPTLGCILVSYSFARTLDLFRTMLRFLWLDPPSFLHSSSFKKTSISAINFSQTFPSLSYSINIFPLAIRYSSYEAPT
jgi:hypothetical protein